MLIQELYKRYVMEIDVNKATHVQWWAEVIGVSEDALWDAITVVGNEVHTVEAYLNIRRAREQSHDRRGLNGGRTVDRRGGAVRRKWDSGMVLPLRQNELL